MYTPALYDVWLQKHFVTATMHCTVLQHSSWSFEALPHAAASVKLLWWSGQLTSVDCSQWTAAVISHTAYTDTWSHQFWHCMCKVDSSCHYFEEFIPWQIISNLLLLNTTNLLHPTLCATCFGCSQPSSHIKVHNLKPEWIYVKSILQFVWPCKLQNTFNTRVISGFHHEVDENFALLLQDWQVVPKRQ